MFSEVTIIKYLLSSFDSLVESCLWFILVSFQYWVGHSCPI